MARREWNVAGNAQSGRLAKSAGVRRNPHEYAGTSAIRQEKTPTENGWGFVIGGGMVPRTKRLLKVRDTGVLASCEVLRAGAKSGG